MKKHLKLCLITNQQEQSISQYLEFIDNAISGGVTMLQLRDKSKNFSQLQILSGNNFS